jgi:hypothetical protein
MKSYQAFLFLTLLACLSTISCYHEFPTGGGGGGTGTATVSFVLVTDTPPSNLGIISFKAVASSLVLTPTTGSATSININGGSGFSYDLARLQSDTGFLGTATGVTTGSFSSVTVNFASAQVAFFNNTGATITNLNPVCPANAVCIATFAGPFAATTTTVPALTASGGIGIDVNLSNVISVAGGTLTLNLANTNSLSSFTLPRQNSNLATGQLALIEDVTGVVSLGGTGLTITGTTAVNRPIITAAVNNATILDEDPTQTLCTAPTAGSISSCVSSNQAASMDVILNSDGTFTAQEVEPLLATLQDTVEGTIVSINSGNQTQFTMIVSDIIPRVTPSSVLGALLPGQALTVNLATAPTPTFFVDSKGLPVAGSFPTSYGTFTGATNTTGLHLGQEVAVHVPALTPASGATPAIANNVDTVTLRWSRFSATPSAGSTNGSFNVTALPAYFGFTQASIFQTEVFTGTPGTEGVTNLDGIANGSTPGANPMGIRALFIEDAGNTLTPAFFAAKVRQH